VREAYAVIRLHASHESIAYGFWALLVEVTDESVESRFVCEGTTLVIAKASTVASRAVDCFNIELICRLERIEEMECRSCLAIDSTRSQTRWATRVPKTKSIEIVCSSGKNSCTVGTGGPNLRACLRASNSFTRTLGPDFSSRPSGWREQLVSAFDALEDAAAAV
jgi:hypothetical protein